MQNTSKPQAEEEENRRQKAYIKRFARRSWPRFWCGMVRHNMLACVRDIIEGVRAPRVLRTRNTGSTLRCCSRLLHRSLAAQTLPVPASSPHSYTRDGYTHDGSGSCYGKYEDTLQRRGWGLPPKLQAAGNGAGTWDGISTSALNKSARTHQRGKGGGSKRGGSGTALGGSMHDMLRSYGTASGGDLFPSMFCKTPIASNLPRRKSSQWDNLSETAVSSRVGKSAAAGGRTRRRSEVPLSTKLQAAGNGAGMWDDIGLALSPAERLGRGQPASERSANRSGSSAEESVRAIGRIYGEDEGAPSGRGLISSMFSTTPVPRDVPHRKNFTWGDFSGAAVNEGHGEDAAPGDRNPGGG